jgi:hypothetical protein
MHSEFQRRQNDWKQRVTILGHAVDATDDIHEEMMMLEMIPTLLNQLMEETETAMNERSTKHLFIKFSKEFLAPPRIIQKCITMIVDFVWRNYSEHSDMWKSWVETKYSTSGQVLEFAQHADQLVLIAKILERKPTEMIEREAIKKLISIADSNQDHLLDSRKSSVNALIKTTSNMLDEQDQSELDLGSFLRMYANASALPTGHLSSPVVRQ